MNFSAFENKTLQEALNDEMKQAVMPVTIFVGAEVVLGFVGNLIVLYIFMFRYQNCNFRYFVLCLALTDITSTLTTMPGEIVTQLYWYIYPFPTICKIKSFFNVFTVSSEALCLLTIAVDRYRKVCHPHRWQIQPKVAKILCLVIYGTAFVISFPVAIFWGTHKQLDIYMGTNVTTTVCERDHKYIDTNKPFHYSLSIEIIISISLFLMFLLYVLIARTILCGKFAKDVKEKSSTLRVTNVKHSHEQQLKDISEDTAQAADTNSGEEDVTSEDQGQDNLPRNRYKYRNSDDPAPVPNTMQRSKLGSKVRRKTMIMFILTVTFIITTILYLTLLSYIADDVLPSLSFSERAVYFFFFRFYFINHVINPLVYGILDPKFRKVMTSCKKWVGESIGKTSSSAV